MKKFNSNQDFLATEAILPVSFFIFKKLKNPESYSRLKLCILELE